MWRTGFNYVIVHPKVKSQTQTPQSVPLAVCTEHAAGPVGESMALAVKEVPVEKYLVIS